jgi:hypothetical protein
VSATGFDLAVIAGVRRRAIPDNFLLVINFCAYQGNTDWTFPGVPVAMKMEAACVVLIGSPM